MHGKKPVLEIRYTHRNAAYWVQNKLNLTYSPLVAHNSKSSVQLAKFYFTSAFDDAILTSSSSTTGVIVPSEREAEIS